MLIWRAHGAYILTLHNLDKHETTIKGRTCKGSIKRVFEIFNVLWNAAIESNTSPQGIWNSIPEWARAYLTEKCSLIAPVNEIDPKFDPARPNLKYQQIQCYSEGNDSVIDLVWDSDGDPPLVGISLGFGFEFTLAYLLPTRAQKEGLAPPPKLRKRIVAE